MPTTNTTKQIITAQINHMDGPRITDTSTITIGTATYPIPHHVDGTGSRLAVHRIMQTLRDAGYHPHPTYRHAMGRNGTIKVVKND